MPEPNGCTSGGDPATSGARRTRHPGHGGDPVSPAIEAPCRPHSGLSAVVFRRHAGARPELRARRGLPLTLCNQAKSLRNDLLPPSADKRPKAVAPHPAELP